MVASRAGSHAHANRRALSRSVRAVEEVAVEGVVDRAHFISARALCKICRERFQHCFHESLSRVRPQIDHGRITPWWPPCDGGGALNSSLSYVRSVPTRVCRHAHVG